MPIEVLRKAARGGDPRAMTALGKRLLVGDGALPAPEEAAEWLRQAASMGDAEAAAQLSVCAAWGVGQPRNIEAALDYLERAAVLGWTSAQKELELLAGESGLAWPELRKKIQVSAWTTSPAAQVVRERPRIVVIDGFMSQAACSWLIERGRPGLGRAKVYRGSSAPQAVDTRTNSEVSLTIFNADVALNLIRERMSAAAGAPTQHFEVAKVLHYTPGQQFALHADFIQPATPQLIQEIQVRGQRAATFLVYLNDDYRGGETDFPRLGFRFKAKRGDALLFSNIDAAGAPDYQTVHAGLPPTTGEKWVLSQWIRTRSPVG